MELSPEERKQVKAKIIKDIREGELIGRVREQEKNGNKGRDKTDK